MRDDTAFDRSLARAQARYDAEPPDDQDPPEGYEGDCECCGHPIIDGRCGYCEEIDRRVDQLLEERWARDVGPRE